MKSEAVFREFRINFPYIYYGNGRNYTVFVTRVTEKGFNLYDPASDRILLNSHLYDTRYGFKPLPSNMKILKTHVGREFSKSLKQVDDIAWPPEMISDWDLPREGKVCQSVDGTSYTFSEIGAVYSCSNRKGAIRYPIGKIHSKHKAGNGKYYLVIDLWNDDVAWPESVKKLTEKKESTMSFKRQLEMKAAIPRPPMYWLEGDEVKGMLQKNELNRLSAEEGSHVKKLAKKIMHSGYSESWPIVVDRDGIIQRGHHRFHACISIGSGAYIEFHDRKFTEDDFHEDVLTEGISKRWATTDHVTRYANAGREQYQKAKEFMDETGMGVKAAIMILEGKSGLPCSAYMNKVKEGFINIPNYEKSLSMARYLEKFADFLTTPGQWKNTYFVGAIMKMLDSSKVDKARLLSCVKSKGEFYVQKDIKRNIESLCDCYNFRLSKGKRIFLQDFS